MKKIRIIFLMIFFCTGKLVNASYLHMDFSLNNQTYNWNNQLEYTYNKNPNFYWGFLFSLNSFLLKQSVRDRWQEDGDIRLKFDYLLKEGLKAGVLLNHKLNSLGEKKVTTQDYLFTTELNLLSNLKLRQNIGFSSLSRESEYEKGYESGFDYSVSLGLGPVAWEKIVVFLDVGQDVKKLERIPSQNRNLKLRLQRYIAEKESLNIEYNESWSKKSFFSGTSPRAYTQRRKERVLRVDASKEIIFNLTFKIEYDFQLKNYHYSTEDDTLSDPLVLRDNSLTSQDYTLSLNKNFFGKFNIEGFYKYTSGEEDYGLKERNQEMEGSELGGRVSSKFSNSDSLFITASIGVTSFFTSPGSFFNDRDILTKILHLEYLHIFSPSFNLKLKTGFKNFHQIYISSQKSANNNYNESYMLSPSLYWRVTPGLNLFQEYQIQANYISYDFQKETESNQNKIFRRASTFTRINYIPYERLEGEFSYLYRYEDYGQLLWKDEWVRRPSWERKTYGFGLGLKYKPFGKIIFSSAYNYELRKDFSILLDLPTGKEKKVYSYKFYRNFLTFSLDYITDDRNYLRLLWTVRTQKEKGFEEEISNYVTVSLGRMF
ncbi:MAG: hypothetical protein OEV55_03610 [candidate division Zixibacteria bacterium]|nr:hypothetical protein [candidate division Zixibacteria bacterium]